jgi:hypothetical protein
MPQFFFAVGFAYRLTFLRRLATEGSRQAVRAVVARCLGLILIGFVLYHLDGKVASWSDLKALGLRGFLGQAFRRELFQTLVHIALASLWILPVIGAATRYRIGFLAASMVLHLILSHAFYFDYAWKIPVIDGGPLGFLSWSIPTIVGSLAYDAVCRPGPSPVGLAVRLFAWAGVLIAAGYGMSCLGPVIPPPPFVSPEKGTQVSMWTMSQRTGSVSYLTFAAGFSLMVYAVFVLICDLCGYRVGIFRAFGRNALAAYILHSLVADAVKPYMPGDSPLWYVVAGFLLYFGICYVLIRYLEKQDLFLRL